MIDVIEFINLDDDVVVMQFEVVVDVVIVMFDFVELMFVVEIVQELCMFGDFDVLVVLVFGFGEFGLVMVCWCVCYGV